MSGDGGVVSKLVRKGEDYKRPNEGAVVRIAYTARIGDGAGPVFEERSREDPLEFTVDEGELWCTWMPCCGVMVGAALRSPVQGHPDSASRSCLLGTPALALHGC